MIDGDLSFEERCDLESHIQMCDQCSTIFKSYKQVSSVLDTISTEYHPAIKIAPQPSGNTFFRNFLEMNGLIPLTGFATITFILIALYFSNELHIKKSPLLSEQSTVSVMSLPLSSFSYYGYTIEDTTRSQYSYVTSEKYTHEYQAVIYRGYESPLFDDKISDNSQFYHSSPLFLE
jgi:hypothetical protein